MAEIFIVTGESMPPVNDEQCSQMVRDGLIISFPSPIDNEADRKLCKKWEKLLTTNPADVGLASIEIHPNAGISSDGLQVAAQQVADILNGRSQHLAMRLYWFKQPDSHSEYIPRPLGGMANGAVMFQLLIEDIDPKAMTLITFFCLGQEVEFRSQDSASSEQSRSLYEFTFPRNVSFIMYRQLEVFHEVPAILTDEYNTDFQMYDANGDPLTATEIRQNFYRFIFAEGTDLRLVRAIVVEAFLLGSDSTASTASSDS